MARISVEDASQFKDVATIKQEKPFKLTKEPALFNSMFLYIDIIS